jgi:hypothetical protein
VRRRLSSAAGLSARQQERLKLLWREGVMFDSDEWLRKITWHTNDLTFEEAFQKTGARVTRLPTHDVV